VQAEANEVDVEPIASYYPGAGQFWLAFRPLAIGAALLAGQFLLTSPVYPIQYEDAIVSQTAPSRASLLGISVEEAIENDTAPVFGLLGGGLIETDYEDAIENDTIPSFGLLAGGLVETEYEDAIENDTAPSFGLLDGALVVYDLYEDAIENDTEPQDSTLT
jgi:hypothetical protein